METGSTEYPSFFVDQFDTFGLGKDTVVRHRTTSDSMLIFDPKKEILHIPYGLSDAVLYARLGWPD